MGQEGHGVHRVCSHTGRQTDRRGVVGHTGPLPSSGQYEMEGPVGSGSGAT